MAPTICRDEALRIGGALALAMVHRPGWGWALTFNGSAFHATVSTPDFHKAGRNGRAFPGAGDTPSAALEAAMTASAAFATTHAVRPIEDTPADGPCRCGNPACPG